MIREFQEQIDALKRQLASGDIGEGGEEEEEDDEVVGPNQERRGSVRVEKKVEYVEKVVERVVEREVIIEVGPTQQEIEDLELKMRSQNELLAHEMRQKREEIQVQKDLAEGEKQNMLEDLQKVEHDRRRQAKKQMEIQAKLEA